VRLISLNLSKGMLLKVADKKLRMGTVFTNQKLGLGPRPIGQKTWDLGLSVK
jgi:hypothetical protein